MRKFLFFLLVLTTSIMSAQTNNNVSGVVYEGNDNQNAVFFANVTLKELGKKVSTDFRGQYNFDGIQSGEYTLIFQFLGCETITKKVTIDNDTSLVIDAHLEKAKLFPNNDHVIGAVDNRKITEL